MNKIIKREDIVRESEPIMYFDVNRLTKDINNLMGEMISIKYNDFTFANMHNVYLTQSDIGDDLPTKIVFHAYHPSVEVTIGIDDAEKYVFIINGSELKLRDYVIRRNGYKLKFYDEEHPDGILNIGDIVRLTIKDDYHSIENAYGIISNIGSKIRITFADPELVNRHKMRLSDGDVTVSIELSGEALMSPFIEEFEIERIKV